MNKLTKRIMALFMAVIMAMPVILAAPFSASADEVLLAHWEFDNDKNGLSDSADKSGFGFGQNWGDGYHYEDGYYFSNGWLRTGNVGSLLTSDYSSNWSMELQFMFPNGNTNRSSGQYIMGITNGYNYDNEDGSTLFGLSANGHVYLYNNDISGESIYNFDYNYDWSSRSHYVKRTIYTLTYAYNNGTISVYIDGTLYFAYNVPSENRSTFESINMITLGACGSTGSDLVAYDLAIYSTSSSVTKEFSPSRSSVIVSNDSDRYNSNSVVLLNETINYNCISAGAWLYDISSIPCASNIVSASTTISVNLAHKPDMQDQYIDFYYINGDFDINSSGNSTPNDYIINSNYQVKWGSGSEGVSSYKRNLGLNNSNHIGTLEHTNLYNGTQITISLTEAVINAKQNGWKNIIIIAFNRNMNNFNDTSVNGGSYWGLVELYHPNINVTYNAPSSSGTIAEMESASSAYQSKMSSGIYTNMKAAYDAYVLTNR